MKSPWWPAVAVAWLGLALPGVRAPATFYIKHVSAGEKDDFPSLSPPPPPTSFSSVTSFTSQKTANNGFESRIYPGTTYNEDFGTFPVDNSLNTGFEDFNDFNSPPSAISPTAVDKSREDYGPTGYNVESGEPPDYQNFYTSDEDEGEEPPSATPSGEEHRDYNDDEGSTPLNYEVEEKIPDDLKYKPPKVTVYPMPPPCKGATPPPWPTNPPPPKPPPKKPKPKPKPNPGGSGYYTYGRSRNRPATKTVAKYRPTGSARYRAATAAGPRLVYRQTPYIIRYSGVNNRPILIRTRAIRPMTVSHPTRPYRSSSKKPPAKPKEIIREVHIHHHHTSPISSLPHPIPIVPIIPLLDENGLPVHRSDANVKSYSMQMTSSGSENVPNFAGFGLAPPGPGSVGLVAVAPAPPTGGDNLATVGRFAEPPPHTTSSYTQPTLQPSPANQQSKSLVLHHGAISS